MRKKIPDNEIVFYTSVDGIVKMEVMVAEENIWLNQKAMAELFGCSTDNISLHLKNIFKSGELDKISVTEHYSATAWRKAPKGKVMQSDVTIAKNYLAQDELKHLNRIGNMYLDFAEMQAARGKVMKMKDWKERLDAFLQFSEYEILTNAGKISQEVAKQLALKEFDKFKPEQDKNYISDFDRELIKLLPKKDTK